MADAVEFGPFYAERLRGYIEMHKGWCNSQNIRNTNDFYNKAESWKFDARFAQGQGMATPPQPTVPKMLAVDEDKCRVAFNAWETGLPQNFNFYVETPLTLPDKFWWLGPPPPPVPSDPVYGPDENRPGWFLVSQGYFAAHGYMLDHPKYGKLMFYVTKSPFGNVYRWLQM